MTTTPSDSTKPAGGRRGGHRSRRTKARKAALDVLFESDLRGVDPLDTLEAYRTTPEFAAVNEGASRVVRDYTEDLVRGVDTHRASIDQRLSAALDDGWTLERMPRVDRALARIAVFEMDHGDVPARVAIAEALVLAGELSTDESPAFLNGVLSAVARTEPLDEVTVLHVHDREAHPGASGEEPQA